MDLSQAIGGIGLGGDNSGLYLQVWSLFYLGHSRLRQSRLRLPMDMLSTANNVERGVLLASAYPTLLPSWLDHAPLPQIAVC